MGSSPGAVYWMENSCNTIWNLKNFPQVYTSQKFYFSFFLPPGPIDYAEHVIQRSQEGYARVKQSSNIHLVFWCLQGHELTTLDHEPVALTTRPWLLAIIFFYYKSLQKLVILISLRVYSRIQNTKETEIELPTQTGL